MTREQAINYLFSSGFTNEQVGEVVRALTYEPTTKNNLGVDLISRADAIRAMQDKAKKLTNEDTINGLCGAVAMLYEMPSVTLQPCDDAVSRKDVVKILGRIEQKVFDGEGFDYEESRAEIDELPSVTPQPRKGHWKLVQRGKVIDVCCSNCEAVRIKQYAYNYTIDELNNEGINEHFGSAEMRYCPNCGSRNEVEE